MCETQFFFFCYLQSLLNERDLLLKNILCNYTKWGFFACYDTQKPHSASEKSWSEIVCLLRGGWKWAWSHFRRGLGICPYEDELCCHAATRFMLCVMWISTDMLRGRRHLPGCSTSVACGFCVVCYVDMDTHGWQI